MNIINNKLNLAPLFGNVINSLSEKSNSENNNLLSNKNIFNKSILWVKLYDNYLYLFLNQNTQNKFSILEPKTKVNTEVNNISPGAAEALPSPALLAYGVATATPVPAINGGGNGEAVTGINKNTIKLINTSSTASALALPAERGIGLPYGQGGEVKKEININFLLIL